MLAAKVTRTFCAVVWLSVISFATSADLRAGAVDRSIVGAEPFGLLTSPLPDGELRSKWLGLARELTDELTVLAVCDERRELCASDSAQAFLDIVAAGKVRDGRARLGEINRAFNLAIRSASDQALYGAADVWRAPLETLAAGAGDCEDYAIAKWVALRAAGVAAEHLRVVILRDIVRQQDHAVAAARLEGRWLLLDNRRMAMVEDVDAKNLQPLFVIDDSGIRQYHAVALPVAPIDLAQLAWPAR